MNFIKKLFKKPKATNKALEKIRFITPTWATLEKPPPYFLCSVGVNDPIQITKYSVLSKSSEDKEFIYFRVLNPFLSKMLEAPDLCVVKISKERLKNLKYKKL